MVYYVQYCSMMIFYVHFNKYIIFLLTQLHAFNGCSWKVQMINDQ